MEDYASLSLAKTNVSAATQQFNFKLSLYLKEVGEKNKTKQKTEEKIVIFMVFQHCICTH